MIFYMLYSIKSEKMYYICSVIKREINKPLSETRKAQKT